MKTSDEITKIVFQKMVDYNVMKEKRRAILIKSISFASIFLVSVIVISLFNLNFSTQIHQSENLGDSYNIGTHYYETNKPDFEIYINLGDNVSYTLDEMIAKSDLIVRAKLSYVKTSSDDAYGELFTLVPIEHNDNEPTMTSEGTKYNKTSGILAELKIIDVLKGEAKTNILMNVETFDYYNYLDYEFCIKNPFSFTEESQTDEYILFLKKDVESGLYMPATSPCAFSVIDNKINLHSGLKSDSYSIQYQQLHKVVNEDGHKNHTGYIIKINLVYPVVEDMYSKTNVNDFGELIRRKVKQNEN